MGYINLVCHSTNVTLDNSGSQMADKGICPLDGGCRVLNIAEILFVVGVKQYSIKQSHFPSNLL